MRLILLLIGVLLSAQGLSKEKPSYETYVEALKSEASAKGFSKETIQTAFEGIKYYKRAVKADKNQPEFKLTLDTYLQERYLSGKSLKQ